LPENPMRRILVDKVVVNIGVGESGERLQKAGELVKRLTGQKPVFTRAKKTIRDFGIRKKLPIGVKVTLRGKRALDFLRRALDARDFRLPESSFDQQGGFSFGIPDYTLFRDVRYDPDIGIFGMDVCVTLARPGMRVARRRRARGKVPRHHRVSREEAMEFVRKTFGVELEVE